MKMKRISKLNAENSIEKCECWNSVRKPCGKRKTDEKLKIQKKEKYFVFFSIQFYLPDSVWVKICYIFCFVFLIFVYWLWNVRLFWFGGDSRFNVPISDLISFVFILCLGRFWLETKSLGFATFVRFSFEWIAHLFLAWFAFFYCLFSIVFGRTKD